MSETPNNKFDFFYSKLMNGQSRFSAASAKEAPEFKGVELIDLLQFVVHWRDVIQFSDKDILVEDDQKAKELKVKLVAAGFNVEPLKGI
jgi:uncharacterized protein YneR